MYTLEDDQETSARLRQRDYQNSPYAAQAQADAEAENTAAPAVEAVASPKGRSSRANGSLKGLTTPGTATSSTDKRLALAALIVACASVFVTSMDETVVVTALPKIIADPGINIPITQLDHAAWIVSAYLLGFVIAMPLMGRVSDIFGRRRIMLLCLAIFGFGSIFCALAPVLGQTWDLSFLNTFGIDTSSPGLVLLISARFIQAIGGGALVPVAMAIVSDFYGKGRLGLALGIVGAVTEAGGVVGPLYGALIVQTLGWTYIFYLNIPIVLLLMGGAWFFTPRHQRLREGIDWLGAILLGLALTCLSLGLAQQGTNFGPSVVNSVAPQNNPVALIMAVVFFVLFILLERLKHWRVPHLSLKPKAHFSLARQARWPVIDLGLFKRLPFSAASLVSLFVGAALIIAMADIPLFVDTVLSQQVSSSDMALVSGLALLRMTALIPVGAIIGGWLCSRLTCRFIGVLGLLFTATGFYLMSRWPISVDWTQITISTMTAGLGFGLVIAPISTTAINAVRSTQAGMGSSIITALRMVGMILGLAALTSWGLAYFKQLASQFPSLAFPATAAQSTKWFNDYSIHLINSAHTVYSSIFFVTMILCLVAVIPAFFLWGRQPALEATILSSVDAMQGPEPVLVLPADPLQMPDPNLHNSVTASVPTAVLTTRVLEDLDVQEPTEVLLVDPLADRLPPVPPPLPRQRPVKPGVSNILAGRRTIIALVGIGLVMLLVAGGLTALLFWTGPSSNSKTTPTAGTTTTPVSGVRMIQLALNNVALSALFTSQLGLTDGTLSDVQATPMPNDGLILTLNLNIKTNGLQRTLPIELDTTVGLDKQQNLQLTVTHVKRDGNDAGATAVAGMQKALNQLVLSAIMPALHAQLQKAKLVAVHTSSTLSCGKGTEMLVMLIQAPPIQGIAAQPTPSSLCFTQPVDLNKLFG